MPQVTPTVLPASISSDATFADNVLAVTAVGNRWFVDEATGNDNNSGSNIGNAFATLDAALAAAVPLNGDVVYLMGTSHRTTTLNWSKNGVSLVGIQAPSGNVRSRISSADTLTQAQATALTPLVNVTAQGCSFISIGTFFAFAGTVTPPTSICWAEAGGRNFYQNVQFLGGGDAVTAAQAGMRSLTIAGNGENVFDSCTIGLDTITRATNANASLEFLAGTARELFKHCVFRAYVSDASDVHVTAAASTLDREQIFDSCFFLNSVDSGGTGMSAAITYPGGGSPGGSIILKNCLSVGAAAIATTGPVYIDGGALGATTTGIAIKAT